MDRPRASRWRLSLWRAVGGDTPCGHSPCGDTALLSHTPCGETPCGYTPCGDTPCMRHAFSTSALLVSRIRVQGWTSHPKVSLMDVSILIQPTFNQLNLRPRYPRHVFVVLHSSRSLSGAKPQQVWTQVAFRQCQRLEANAITLDCSRVIHLVALA